MPSRHELVAHERNEEQIAKAIGADHVIFQTMEKLEDSVRQFNPEIKRFDCSVFTGDYVTGGVTEEYFEHLESLRADNNRSKLEGASVEMVEPTKNGLQRIATEGLELSATSSPSNTAVDVTVGLYNSFNHN